MVACLSQHENTPAPEREREKCILVYTWEPCVYDLDEHSSAHLHHLRRGKGCWSEMITCQTQSFTGDTHTHIITITAFRNNTDTLEFWRRKKEIFSFERQRWRTWNSCPCCYLLAGRDLNHLLNMRATKIIKLSQSWKRNKRRKNRNVGGRETTDK